MSTEYRFITIIRGFSALLVVLNHLRSAYFIDFSQVENKNLLNSFFYFITGFGHYAVIVFFVLSGFLVTKSFLKTKEIKSYAFNRLIRLWLPLLPVLLFTFFLDSVSKSIDSTIFTGQYFNVMHSGPQPGQFSNSVITFIGNVFFLQSIFVEPFGSNGPLWSLSYEFWYYTLFPLMFFLFSASTKHISRILSTAALCLIVYMLPFYALVGYLCWLLGGFVNKFINYRLKYTLLSFIISLILFLVTVSLFRIKPDILGHSYIGDIVLSLIFSVVVLTSLRVKIKLNNFINRIVDFMSDVSYTLYIIHFPIVYLVFTLLYRGSKREFNLINLLGYFITLAAIYVVTYIFWYLFERNTEKLKLLMKERFFR